MKIYQTTEPESIRSIAKKHCVSEHALAALNGLTPRGIVPAGVSLLLPLGARGGGSCGLVAAGGIGRCDAAFRRVSVFNVFVAAGARPDRALSKFLAMKARQKRAPLFCEQRPQWLPLWKSTLKIILAGRGACFSAAVP